MDSAAACSVGGRGLIPTIGIQMVFPPLGFKMVERNGTRHDEKALLSPARSKKKRILASPSINVVQV